MRLFACTNLKFAVPVTLTNPREVVSPSVRPLMGRSGRGWRQYHPRRHLNNQRRTTGSLDSIQKAIHAAIANFLTADVYAGRPRVHAGQSGLLRIARDEFQIGSDADAVCSE